MASIKRENPTSQEQEQPLAKKLKNKISNDFSNFEENIRVVLNPADCDLAFKIEANGLTGSALSENGFAYCWSGARGNIGIIGGKYFFGCKIVSNQSVVMEDTPLNQQHISRVGISLGNDPLGNLGETECSFGYGGTGKFSNNGKFMDYGEKFGVGDTIVCLVDLESKPFASIEFSKNGKRLGIAKEFDLPLKSAFFPHVMLKNTVVEMQFSLEDELVFEEGYKPWSMSVKDGKAVMGPTFSDSKDCEVIMLVGLPASGKTTWAEKWVKEHPEKRYIVLGTNLALDQMKVPGLLRKFNYGERFDRLMDRATGIFNTLLSIASTVPRNYIIDQTNVYKSARKRKLKPFFSFHKIAVVLFPRQEELKLRSEKRFKEMGKEVPSEAINQMIANFEFPKSKDMLGTDEYFDEVLFVELCREEAQKHLDGMKRSLSSSLNPKSDRSPNTYLGYSRPRLGLQRDGGFSIGHPVPGLQPTPADSYRGYNRGEQPGIVDSMQPYSSSNVNRRYADSGYSGRSEPLGGPYYPRTLNPIPSREFHPQTYPSYSNPVPQYIRGDSRIYSNPVAQYIRGDSRTYSSYTYNAPHNENDLYEIPGYENNTVYARSAYQPPYVGPYATPNPRPQEGYQADVQRPEAPPYYPPQYY